MWGVRERPFDFYGGARIIFEIKRQDAPFEEKKVRTVPHKKKKGRMQVVAIKKRQDAIFLKLKRQDRKNNPSPPINIKWLLPYVCSIECRWIKEVLVL